MARGRNVRLGGPTKATPTADAARTSTITPTVTVTMKKIPRCALAWGWACCSKNRRPSSFPLLRDRRRVVSDTSDVELRSVAMDWDGLTLAFIPPNREGAVDKNGLAAAAEEKAEEEENAGAAVGCAAPCKPNVDGPSCRDSRTILSSSSESSSGTASSLTDSRSAALASKRSRRRTRENDEEAPCPSSSTVDSSSPSESSSSLLSSFSLSPSRPTRP